MSLQRQLTYKKQKRYQTSDLSDDMTFFSRPSSTPQFLVAPLSKKSHRRRDDLDDFLSSDLELSFASTVSLHSPPRNSVVLAPASEFAEPMDISPAPAPRPVFTRPTKEDIVKTRPRAFTSAARMFGNDMSNSIAAPSPQVAPSLKTASNNVKRTQRAALPMEWLVGNRPSESMQNENIFSPPPTQAPLSPPAEDAMDIDSVSHESSDPLYSPAPVSAAPTITQFDTLFYDTMSPCRSLDSPSGPQPKKRRSLSPDPVRMFEQHNSSSPAQSSPSQRKLERMSSGPLLSNFAKPTLQGLGNPSVNALKRPRRPALSAMIPPLDTEKYMFYPVLSPGSPDEDSKQNDLPPPRRAFSALLPPKGFQGFLNEPSSDESSFDGPDMSSPAQAYAKRQSIKTIRRCDGTDDFRPLTGATAMVNRDNMESPSAKFLAAGMPGFGDNEAHGKILPCHRVKEDGLMRINAQTLDKLLDGFYNSEIAEYHIIDCRFDYEYLGGHIPGAVNVNTTAAVEDLLLGSNIAKPRPSVSGDPAKKTILVFHCEFSMKRAPTFAKHLRAKDRALNNHVYPKIHFPEVYILEGGYCQYFRSSAARCEPSAYVTMDDPTHAVSRKEDLGEFRKARFGRHKSYAYGDGATKIPVSQQQQPKRNTAPSGGANPVFAAANAARTRRGGGGGLTMLAEDGNTTAHSDDEDTDIGDSPCPPPTKTTVFKGKKMGRAPIARAETYGPARMVY